MLIKRIKSWIQAMFTGDRWMMSIPVLMLFLSALLFLIFPPLIRQYFGGAEFWDTAYYHDLVHKGYFKREILAFYPLWPLILKAFHEFMIAVGGIHPDIWINLLAALLNITGLFIGALLFKKVFKEPRTAAFVFFLYAFNPYGVFRFIGYSESLFSLLSFLLLYLLYSPEMNKIRYPLIFVLSALLSLCRPVLAPWICALLVAFFILFLQKHLTGIGKNTKPMIGDAVSIMIGLMVGYSIFGGYFISQGFSFFDPFRVQTICWHKKFSLMNLPKNLFFPSTGGGTVVLIWDFVALWTPILLTAIPLVRLFWKRKEQRVFSGFPATFCLIASLGMSMIVALTQDCIQSIGRYNFAAPLIFIPIGMALESLSVQRKGKVKWVLAIVTLWGFVTWWVLYGTKEFMG